MELTTGAFRLFRIAGIEIYLHWSWFVVAVVEIAYRDGYHYPVWRGVEYLGLFGIVLLHEFGHVLACRSVGGRADQIVLWPLGGVAYVAPPPRPGAVLWSIAAGPLVNVILAIVSIILYGIFPDHVNLLNVWKQDASDLDRFLSVLVLLNLSTLIFNLIPVYPLDGGQIVHALLWFAVGRWRSLMYVSLVGMGFGCLLFFAALLASLPKPVFGLMLAAMAGFIIFRSFTAFQQCRSVLFLRSLPRHSECECPHCGLGPPKGPFWVCEHCSTRFDLFDARGKCPACGAWYLQPDCPHCRHANHIDKWYIPTETIPATPASGAPPAEAPPAETPPG